MPMRWDKGRKSPYECNHFAVLGVGPNTRRKELSEVSENKRRVLQTGNKIFCACGHEVDGHEVGHSTSQLLEAGRLAEELLLTHPQPPRDNRAKIKALADNLRQAATLPMVRNPIPLRSPIAVLWFVPRPGPEAIPLPSWEDLGLVRTGDPEDLALDIVFDR